MDQLMAGMGALNMGKGASERGATNQMAIPAHVTPENRTKHRPHRTHEEARAFREVTHEDFNAQLFRSNQHKLGRDTARTAPVSEETRERDLKLAAWKAKVEDRLPPRSPVKFISLEESSEILKEYNKRMAESLVSSLHHFFAVSVVALTPLPCRHLVPSTMPSLREVSRTLTLPRIKVGWLTCLGITRRRVLCATFPMGQTTETRSCWRNTSVVRVSATSVTQAKKLRAMTISLSQEGQEVVR